MTAAGGSPAPTPSRWAPPPRLTVEVKNPGELVLGASEPAHLTELIRQICDAFGSRSDAAADRMLDLLLNALRSKDAPVVSEAIVNGALATMHGIGPRDEVEAMLACQMIATHQAAMMALRRVGFSEAVEQQDSNGNLVTKLLRTYTAQVEALHRYRNKGEQKVRVEHVHVYSGGQAIVGCVETGAAGGSANSEGQAHA